MQREAKKLAGRFRFLTTSILVMWVVSLVAFVFLLLPRVDVQVMVTHPAQTRIIAALVSMALFTLSSATLLLARALFRMEEAARVAEQQHAAKLAKANRALRALSLCNEVVIRASEELELLNEVCRIVVETAGYRMAWVGYAEEDEARTIRPVAHAGDEGGYLDDVRISWAEDEWGRGPTGTAIRAGKPTIGRDIRRDPAFAPWREEALKRGYASSIALPLIADGKTLGALNIYSGELEAFDAEEVELLSELADDLAYGIAALRIRARQKQAEEELRQSGRRLAEAERIAHLGSWDWDMVNKSMWWSDEVYRIFGGTPQTFDATYEAFLDLVHPDDRDIVNNAVEAAIKEKKSLAIDHRIVLPDGSSRVVHEQGEVFFNEEEKPLRMLGTVQDITERKQMEEQLRRMQKMEAIGRLTGGIAHDFNNLLTVINGYSEMLADELAEEDPKRELVQEVSRAGHRAAALTRQLLAFGRKQVLQPEVLNLNAVVSEMDKMLRRVIGEDIDLVTVLDPELGNAKVDPSQMEQVIMNLAVNARDAMPQGGSLTIETGNVELDEEYARQHAEAEPGSYVMLALSDNGVGMDAETQARIFEPFFTTKLKGEGTGFGLSTVYGIVKQSGGNINVYSEPAKGTTFKIYLPRVEEPAGVEHQPEASPERAGRGETVLVVEDEPGVRRLARTILERNGYVVLEGADGSEGIRVCEEHREEIHLLLTDVVLPDTGGPALAERVTALCPRVKVLYMSGYTNNAIAHRGVLEPGVVFLPKPFTPEALLSKVREVLESPHS